MDSETDNGFGMDRYGVDRARLGAWLDQRFGGSEPTEVEAIPAEGPRQYFSVCRGDQNWVMRRSPTSECLAAKQDVLREFLVLDSIQDEPVRVPRTIAASDDPEIIGAPFFIVERVEGVPIRSSLPKLHAADPRRHREIVLDSIDVLAEIHRVDWERCGLHKLGKPEGYLGRQVPRWITQLDRGRRYEAAGYDELAVWLSENLPLGRQPTLVHGDYKLDNLMYSTRSPRVLSVINWDMATIGDPLVDLAWSLIFLPSPGNPLSLGGPGRLNGFAPSELPCLDEVMDRYSDLTHADLSEMLWYNVFARWKLAILLEGVHAGYLRGESKNPVHQFFSKIAERLVGHAVELVNKD